jgi:hypothetical protein
VGEFVRDRLKGAPLTLLLDRDGALAGRLGLGTYPQFTVLDGKGRRLGEVVYSLDEALALARPLTR